MIALRNPLRKLGVVPFDNNVLQSLFPDCKRINDKARYLSLNGEIIRLKKGLYVVSSEDSPFSKELIANTIYGPSYVSMNWALSYWGLIPERVHNVESVTTKHTREFYTPIGLFTYKNCPPEYFPIGVTRRDFDGALYFLIATPEKALCDYICYNKLFFRYRKDVAIFLEEDLRFEMDYIQKLDVKIIEECALVSSKRRSLLALSDFIKHEQHLIGTRPIGAPVQRRF